MNIITPIANSNAVSLKQLIPEHYSLKLLILHTPFNIEISTLSQCFNLVKLDLSKNNIKSFPYLGDLKYLKIIFIHENLLGIDEFAQIFEKGEKSSTLCENVVWITYWGNKNVFLARHFTVNKTKAIAFDKNMIAEEQKCATLNYKESFSKETDISDLFLKRNLASSYSTEEEYMQDFWLSLRILRNKYELLNPIIKVQKWFRGWNFRTKLKRSFLKQRSIYLTLYHCFKQWKDGIKNAKKLLKILTEKKKTYLLYSGCKINREQIHQRMRELARQAKHSVLKRRLILQNQIKFYSILRGNYLIMQDLYAQLNLKQSQAIFIHKSSIDDFSDYVVPFVKLFTDEVIEHSFNQHYHLHFLHQQVFKFRSQFLKMLKTNTFSIVSYEKPLQKMLAFLKFKKPSHLENKMKAIFGKVHVSRQQKERMAQHERKIEAAKKEQRDQLLRIEGSFQLLKLIVRGVYFYNSKRLSLSKSEMNRRINLFSENSLKRISSAVAIQRAWKGFIFRKKHQNQLKIILKFQKAATILQRWFRRLPITRRKFFLYDVINKFNQLQQSSFYVELEEYRDQIRHQAKRREKYIFLEQHAQIYKNNENGDLFLTWDAKSHRFQIKQMIRVNKPLFSQPLLSKEAAEKTIYTPNKLQPCDFPHLFHYQTESSIIKKYDKKYLEIKCKSKAEAKFRILGIALLTFDFKLKRSMTILHKSHFLVNQLTNKTQIASKQYAIICNENIKFIKTIEQSCNKIQNLSIYMINNRIFLQFDNNSKPFKVEQRFFIYMIGFQENQRIYECVAANSNENQPYYRSAKMHNASLADLSMREEYQNLRQSANVEQIKINRQRKILVKKRSIKQFNAKKFRKNTNHPNFIIDNKSSDRITQNESNLPISSDRDEHINRGRQFSHIQKSQTKGNREDMNAKVTLMQERRKKMFEIKKEDESFTRKFVNLGNFMQNQFINDHRRRIKTEIEQEAYISAEEVRAANHSSKKEEKSFQKYQKARELDGIHKSLVKSNRALASQHSLILKKNVLANQQRIKRQYNSIKKPKVSFAEQSFPIIFPKQRNLSVN